MKIKKRKKNAKELSPSQSRYRFKAGFADGTKNRSRAAYRKDKGKDFELNGNVVLRSLEFLDEEAQELPVMNQMNNELEVMPVLRLTAVAKLLDMSYQTIWRWTSETKQLPSPILIDTSQGREYEVYHVEEVRVMLRVIGEHLNQFKYYRKDHEGTKTKLFTQIDALRVKNFTNGEPSHGRKEKGQKPSRKIKRNPRKKGGY